MSSEKSEAERMAYQYKIQVAGKLWLNKEMTSNEESYLAGFKAAVAQAELKSYAGVIRIVDLKKLLEPKS